MIPILVISSPDPIRQENVKKQFAAQNGHWSESYELVPAVMMPTARYGIAKSHKKCVQMAKDRGWKQCVICEDDIEFLSPNSLLNYYAIGSLAIRDDWEIYTGGLYSGEIADPDTGRGYSRVIGSFSGLHLYTVNHSYYDTFLSLSETMNIDYELSAILKANIYCAYPILVKELDNQYSYNAGKIVEYGKMLCHKYKCINAS